MNEPAPTVLNVPDDVAAGVYAELLTVWNNPYGFTFDFGALQPQPVTVDGPDGPVQVAQGRVVARVKVPARAIQGMLAAISENLTKHEAAFGPVTAPRTDPPLYPPSDSGGE